MDYAYSVEDSRASLFELLRLNKRLGIATAEIDWTNPDYPMPYMAIRKREIIKRNVNIAGSILHIPPGSRKRFVIVSYMSYDGRDSIPIALGSSHAVTLHAGYHRFV